MTISRSACGKRRLLDGNLVWRNLLLETVDEPLRTIGTPAKLPRSEESFGRPNRSDRTDKSVQSCQDTDIVPI